MRRLLALTALALLSVVLVAVELGFTANSPRGTVGGVEVSPDGTGLAIDLNGRVATTRPSSAGGRRRVVVSPDGRWQAVLELPGMSGNTGTVALGRHAAGARLRIVERHLYAGPAAVGWSPDSRWLAFVRWVPHLLSAVAVSTDGRRQVLAAPSCGDSMVGSAWAPGGNRIALSVPAPHTGCRKGIDLRIRAVGGSQTVVIARGISGTPLWSPDGRWIATTGGRAEVMRADGTRRRDLGGWLVAWSSRDDVLAVTDQQRRSLGIGRAAGEIRIFDRKVDDTTAPSFSPRGRLVAYARDDGIVVRRVVDRSVVARVPMSNARADRISWTRDGRSLLVHAFALRQGD